jgi:hypothetical protein
MVWSPQVRRVARKGGGDGWIVGHRLVDEFSEFAASRARPNTVRAYAHDLKAFFTIVGKEPVEVTGVVDGVRDRAAPAPADLRDGGEAAELGGRLGGGGSAAARSRYQHIGSAFPPPGGGGGGFGHPPGAVAEGAAEAAVDVSAHVHDPVLRVLRSRPDFLTARRIADLAAGFPGGARLSLAAVLGRLRHLGWRLHGLPRAAGARPPPALRRQPGHDQLGGFQGSR